MNGLAHNSTVVKLLRLVDEVLGIQPRSNCIPFQLRPSVFKAGTVSTVITPCSSFSTFRAIIDHDDACYQSLLKWYQCCRFLEVSRVHCVFNSVTTSANRFVDTSALKPLGSCPMLLSSLTIASLRVVVRSIVTFVALQL